MTTDSIDLKSLKAPLAGIEIFDRLTPLEYESLFLRTLSTLAEIKDAYSRCINSASLHRDVALRFALDPMDHADIDPDNWLIYPWGDSSIMLTTKNFEDGIKYVEDRPTISMLNLFMEDEKVGFYNKLDLLFPSDTVLPIPLVQKLFDLSRSTIQKWESGLKRLDNLRLKTKKADDAKHSTCLYGDLLPFLKFHFSSSQR